MASSPTDPPVRRSHEYAAYVALIRRLRRNAAVFAALVVAAMALLPAVAGDAGGALLPPVLLAIVIAWITRMRRINVCPWCGEVFWRYGIPRCGGRRPSKCVHCGEPEAH